MMKKQVLSAALLLCFLTTAALPAYGAAKAPAASTSAAGLTGAIERAKTTLAIDSDLWDDFTYSSYESEQGQRWSLLWTQSADDRARLSASINEQGVILSYYLNGPSEAQGLATVRQEAAQQRAQRFLEKVAAGYIDTLAPKPQESAQQSGDAFTFFYEQAHDGVPVADGQVTVSVSKYTNEVTSFNVASSVNVTALPWPDKGQAITAAQAESALLEKIGVELVYLSRYDYRGDDYTIYPVYRLSKNDLVIDALTGQTVSARDQSLAQYANESAADAGGGVARSKLSPKELAAVEQQAQLISSEEAAGKLWQALNLSGTVQSSALNTTYTDKQRYIWQLELAAAGNAEANISGTVDAQTGQVLSFYRYDAATQPLEAPQSKAVADGAVQALLAQLAPEELAQCRAVPEQDADRRQDETTYVYRFERLAGGIAFPENGLSVRYNAALGQITSYQLTWQRQAAFPDVSKAKTAQAIVRDMVQNADFRLLYQRDGQTYRLIYDFHDQSAMRFDPFTGQRLDWQGKPYTTQALPAYQWPAGISESAVRLLENGIYLDKRSLNISAPLTQQELAALLYRSRYPYAELPESQSLYDELASMGLILSGEAAPEATVTRQQAARCAARLLGYQRLLAYPQLFAYPYTDAAEGDYQASIAIAGALGLLEADSGGSIRPTAAITLGEAFDLLYKALRG